MAQVKGKLWLAGPLQPEPRWPTRFFVVVDVVVAVVVVADRVVG